MDKNGKKEDAGGIIPKAPNKFNKILYLIFDYPHKHYTFKYFEV